MTHADQNRLLDQKAQEEGLEPKDVGSAFRALYWNVIGSFFILSLFGIAIYASKNLNWADIVVLLGRFTFPTLLGALAFGFLQVVFQAARLWILLPQNLPISFPKCFLIFTSGQFLNQVLPARAGDLLKVAWLKRLGDKRISEKVRTSEILGGVFIADKAADLIALLIWISLLSPGLFPELGNSENFSLLLQLEGVEVLLGVGGTAVVLLLLWRSVGARIKSSLEGVFQGAKKFLEPRRFFFALALALMAWITEAWILKQFTHALGYPLTVSQSLIALAILNIGIAVPISLANIGAFEGALAFGLSRFEVPLSIGLAIATAYHAIQILAVTIPAVGHFLLRKLHRRQARTNLRSGSELWIRDEDKTRAIRYYESRSVHYSRSASRGPLFLFRQRERHVILSFLGLESAQGKTLLDVGCGDGKYSLLAQEAGLRVSSMDVSPGMIDTIRGKVERAWVGDIESISPGMTYDRVLCSGVLDFVLDPPAAFAILCQSVSPGGRLVVLVPHRSWCGLLYRLEKRLSGFRVNLFSREELEIWAKAQGLRLVESAHPLPTNLVLRFERPSVS